MPLMYTPEWYARRDSSHAKRYQRDKANQTPRYFAQLERSREYYWAQFSTVERRARTKRRNLKAFLLARAAERAARRRGQ